MEDRFDFDLICLLGEAQQSVVGFLSGWSAMMVVTVVGLSLCVVIAMSAALVAQCTRNGTTKKGRPTESLAMDSPPGKDLSLSFIVFIICLQCIDAVGWAAGRASGL